MLLFYNILYIQISMFLFCFSTSYKYYAVALKGIDRESERERVRDKRGGKKDRRLIS